MNSPVVLSFHNRRNATYVARAIEVREALNMAPSDPYTLMSLSRAVEDEDPQHHYLQAYEEFSSLLEVCQSKESDTLFVTEMETPEQEPIEFYGELFSTEK